MKYQGGDITSAEGSDRPTLGRGGVLFRSALLAWSSRPSASVSEFLRFVSFGVLDSDILVDLARHQRVPEVEESSKLKHSAGCPCCAFNRPGQLANPGLYSVL